MRSIHGTPPTGSFTRISKRRSDTRAVPLERRRGKPIMEGMVREAIVKAMDEQGVTGYALAKASGVPKSVVYLFLSGRPKKGKQEPTKRVDLAHVDAMLKALNLTVSPAPARRPGRRR